MGPIKNKALAFIIAGFLVFTLTGCIALIGVGLVNDAEPILPKNLFSPSNDRAIVFFSIEPSEHQSRVVLQRFFPTKTKLRASCAFYTFTLVEAYGSKTTNGRQYYAFSVQPGYYLHNQTMVDGKSVAVKFKVAQQKVNYLGNFHLLEVDEAPPVALPPGSAGIAALTQDTSDAVNALKQFPALKWSMQPAEQVNLDGQTEEIPFCSL